MYTIENFEIDSANGSTLREILDTVGETEFVRVLNEYVETIDDENVEEKLFYEDEDAEILSKFGFVDLIG